MLDIYGKHKTFTKSRVNKSFDVCKYKYIQHYKIYNTTSIQFTLILNPPLYLSFLTDANIICIARVRYDEDTVCEYKFTYDLDENGETNIRIEDTSCPPTNVAAISIIAVIIATFLIGFLILLICKCQMYFADKREFAKFEEERKKYLQAANENPLYKSPITTFRNPHSPDIVKTNAFELK